jgi:hypothetical protein
MSQPLPWINLRSWNSSQRVSFEHVCVQFAAHEEVPPGSFFTRKAAPDGGVEGYWTLSDGSEWGFQAKFFLSPPKSAEWAQIDDSVSQALSKHPALKRYTVCLPIDRQDPRVPKTEWFKDQWDKRVQKWQSWAKGLQRLVEFEYWGESELLDRFGQEKHAGRYSFWFSGELFSKEWFRQQFERTKENAGPRYTPELNVDLPIAEIFEGLSRSDDFKSKIATLRAKLARKSRIGVSEHEKFLISPNQALNESMSKLFSRIDLTITALSTMDKQIDWAGLQESIHETETKTEACRAAIRSYEEQKRELRGGKEAANREHSSMFADHQYRFREVEEILYQLNTVASGLAGAMANSGALLIRGKVGSGKTHLLCDLVFRRLARNAPSVILLGQHFTRSEPWKQIISQLGLNCSPRELLGALQAAAEAAGERCILVIDALNEGEGKLLWKEHLPGLLLDIGNFPGISVALSVRTSYESLVAPQNLSPTQLTRVTHTGFSEKEYEAARMFFSHFKIKMPSIPLLAQEFRNPLFLKIFCKGLFNKGLDQVPTGLKGITSILQFFLDSVDEKLASPQYLDYDPKAHLTLKAVNALAERMSAAGATFLPRPEAKDIVDQILPGSGFDNSLFRHLLSEGVIAEDRFPSSKDEEWLEVVHFAYERFTDHLIARRLLISCIDAEELELSLEPTKTIGQLFKDDSSCWRNKGLLEAFCVQVPERFGKEFPDMAVSVRSTQAMREAFLESLIWRNLESFGDPTRTYINSEILKYQGGWEALLEVILTVATNPGHPYNGLSLHRKLMALELATRDNLWSIFLFEHFGERGSVDRLLDWSTSEDDKSYLSEEALELCGITLGWFLTTSQRTVRDQATKGLVKLFKDRLSVLGKLLETFKSVDDPYVIERIYCVAYGCAMKGNKIHLRELALWVYKNVFEDGKPYPNILLRDYARGIIELASKEYADLDVDLVRVRPPYHSDFPSDVPSLESLEEKYGWKDKDDERRRVWYGIYDSVLGYGDFARYVIGTNSGHFEWCNRKLTKRLSRKKILSEERFDLGLAQRWIFNRVVELGWSPDLFGAFDTVRFRYYGRESNKPERIGKKYQWIAFYEFLARVSDNFVFCDDGWNSKPSRYDGPWQLRYVRNIDPSCTLSRDHSDSQAVTWWSPVHYENWSFQPVKNWIKETADLPDLAKLLRVVDPADGSSWLVLETHRSFEKSMDPYEERYQSPTLQMWYQVRSYLVKKQYLSRVFNWVKGQDLWGRWMPESHETYGVFLGEFFWSSAFKFHDTPYYNHEGWTRGRRGKGGLPVQVLVPTDMYSHERGYDSSIEGTIHIYLPARELAELMGLKWGGVEGEFVDADGTVTVRDPAVRQAGPHALLVREKPFLDLLARKGLSFFWTALGQKWVLGPDVRLGNWEGELQINGSYILQSNKIVGKQVSKFRGAGEA